MRVHLVVVLEPGSERDHDGVGVGPWIEPDAVGLESLRESLGDAVGLRAAEGVVDGGAIRVRSGFPLRAAAYYR